MTVASPTTGLALAPDFETDSPLFSITCMQCASLADLREPFCAHCGTRVAVATLRGRRPADVAATRSLQFGLLVILANVVVGGLAFGVVYLVSDAARFSDAALVLDALKFVLVTALSIVAIRFGVRGLRATSDGRLARRGWAVGGIVIGSIFILLVTLSLVATAILTGVL